MNTETKTKIDELIARLGVSMSHTPPTLAGIKSKTDGKASFWHCLEYEVRIKRETGGGCGWPYRMGLGNFQQIQHQVGETDSSKPLPQWKRDEIEYLLEFVELEGAPTLPDVLFSLLSDGSAFFDGVGFEEWCSEYGYNEDSRTAERIFNECEQTGESLSRIFTPAEIQELREAFQNY